MAEPKFVTAKGSSEDRASLAKQYEDDCSDGLVGMLAEEFGVSPDALRRLHVGWIEREPCYAFPERNAKGAICGVSLPASRWVPQQLPLLRSGVY